MQSALKYSQSLMNELVDRFPEGNFIDATLGNGNDIERILRRDNFKGHAYGFDIQEQAINNTREKLTDIPKENYTLFKDSHSTISRNIPSYINISGAIFNLGYLPGGDHDITTNYTSTLEAISQILERLVKGGQIIIVVYSGHPEGMVEKNKLLEELAKLPQEEYQVLKYSFINQINNPPLTLVIEKR